MKEFWREKALPWIEKGKARLSKLNGWMRLWFVATVIWAVATSVAWVKNDWWSDFPAWSMAEYELWATKEVYDRSRSLSFGGKALSWQRWPGYYYDRLRAQKYPPSKAQVDSARDYVPRAEEVDAALAAKRDDKEGGYQVTKRSRNRMIFRAWKSRLFDFPASMLLPPIGFLLLVKLSLVTIAWIGAGFQGSGNPTDD